MTGKIAILFDQLLFRGVSKPEVMWGTDHRLNMVMKLQSLSGLHTAVLIGCHPATSLAPHFGLYTRALLINKNRRHIFVTPWDNELITKLF
jgi:hypothetical protein